MAPVESEAHLDQHGPDGSDVPEPHTLSQVWPQTLASAQPSMVTAAMGIHKDPVTDPDMVHSHSSDPDDTIAMRGKRGHPGLHGLGGNLFL